MDKEHSGVPHRERRYLDLIQNVFDSRGIDGATATIERIDEYLVVFGLRHESGGSAVAVSRNILRSVNDVILMSRHIADELISGFTIHVTAGKEDEKAGYRAAFTVIDEWSDSHA